MEKSISGENAQKEASILVTDAKKGDWLEVSASASELVVKMHEAEGGLTGADIDEVRGKIAKAEELYKAAKELGEVSEDQIKMIDLRFDELKIG